jgi:hypothetical protein
MALGVRTSKTARRPYIDVNVKKQVIRDYVRIHGRPPTPDELIKEARDPQHPLHEAFNFKDVQGAALAHWRDIARKIIAEVTIMVETSTRLLDAVVYIEDPNKEHGEQGYIQVAGQPKRVVTAMLEVALRDVESMFLRGLGIAAQHKKEKQFVDACRKLIHD